MHSTHAAALPTTEVIWDAKTNQHYWCCCACYLAKHCVRTCGGGWQGRRRGRAAFPHAAAVTPVAAASPLSPVAQQPHSTLIPNAQLATLSAAKQFEVKGTRFVCADKLEQHLGTRALQQGCRRGLHLHFEDAVRRDDVVLVRASVHEGDLLHLGPAKYIQANSNPWHPYDIPKNPCSIPLSAILLVCARVRVTCPHMQQQLVFNRSGEGREPAPQHVVAEHLHQAGLQEGCQRRHAHDVWPSHKPAAKGGRRATASFGPLAMHCQLKP